MTYYRGGGYKETIKFNGDSLKQLELGVPGATVLLSQVTLGVNHPQSIQNKIVNGTNYALQDHLGSTDVVVGTNPNSSTPVMLQRISFNAFGERRETSTWKTIENPIGFTHSRDTDKGFTGHEQLESLNLVHMNGRIYDPHLGRFLSADPHIQSAGNTQSYNRYSYVLNNPLSLTDPSEYFLRGLFKSINRLITNPGFVRLISGLTISLFIGPSGFGLLGGGLTSSIAGGFIGAFVATGGISKRR